MALLETSKLTSGFFKAHKLAWLVFGVSFALRLGYWWMISDESPMDSLLSAPPDTLRYIQLARDFTELTISNEDNLYMTGFGYSLFLGSLLLLLGMSFHAVMFVQIILSSITSVLIYRIGYLLTGKSQVGFIAGFVNATSLTAMSLTVSFLSETLFVFLLSLATLVFLRSVSRFSLRGFIVLGLIIAYAVFTRSVGIFLPFVFVLAVLATPRSQLFQRKKSKLLGYTLISAATALTLVSAWSFRNYTKHETFVAAGTGPGAAAMYLGARVSSDRIDSVSVYQYRRIINHYRAEFKREFAASQQGAQSQGELNELYLKKLKNLFEEDPASFTITFLKIIKENLFAPDDFLQLRMPDSRLDTSYHIRIAWWYKSYLLIALPCLFGAGILFFKRITLGATLLVLYYLGFAFTSGFTYWQGSRIFYPAQVAWSVLFAVGVYYPVSYLSSRFRAHIWPVFLPLIERSWNFARGAIWTPNNFLRFTVPVYKKLLILVSFLFFTALLASVIIPLLRPAKYVQVDGVAGHLYRKSVEVTGIELKEVAGSTKSIIFNYRVRSVISDSYRVFLRFHPKGKSKMINRDFSLTLPTEYWNKGWRVLEEVELDLEPGDYSVNTGFFYGQVRLGEALSFQITVR